jgi:hypothetical protein
VWRDRGRESTGLLPISPRRATAPGRSRGPLAAIRLTQGNARAGLSCGSKAPRLAISPERVILSRNRSDYVPAVAPPRRGVGFRIGALLARAPSRVRTGTPRLRPWLAQAQASINRDADRRPRSVYPRPVGVPVERSAEGRCSAVWTVSTSSRHREWSRFGDNNDRSFTPETQRPGCSLPDVSKPSREGSWWRVQVRKGCRRPPSSDA